MMRANASSGFGAVHAGVQVGHRTRGFKFGVAHAAQADAQRRQIGCEHFRIGDQRKICFETVRVLAYEARDAFATNFFFAFDDHAHIDGQLATRSLEQRLQRLNVHVHLAFVVHRAARVDVLVTLGGFEGWCVPLVQGVRRLHVVMSVAEHRWLSRGLQPVAIHQRMS
jgi:hypothetical protein